MKTRHCFCVTVSVSRRRTPFPAARQQALQLLPFRHLGVPGGV
jgi:hypothetical protein